MHDPNTAKSTIATAELPETPYWNKHPGRFFPSKLPQRHLFLSLPGPDLI
ncbi:glutathione-dependent formaldehyde-activating, GFA [Roseibium sp. TrichSKD4]|nr:glutathione-dependent formaldehyde-activating, GFA [Roseibium sp. TrichSKD4]